jgi:hypothetical protein
MAIHSTFPKGSTILIIMKDRTQIKTKYIDNKSGVIITKDGKFNKKDISSTSFYKPSDKKD